MSSSGTTCSRRYAVNPLHSARDHRSPMIHRLAAAALIAAAWGCTTFGPVNARDYVTAKRPPEIWVWKSDSSVVQMRGPHFLGADTLVGLIEGAYTEVPISEVTQ